MTGSDPIDNEALAKRRVPCMVAFLHPFRLVDGPSSPAWNVSVDDINRGEWDYTELHSMVGGIDVGMPAPYHMVIARDGAVGLPTLPHLRSDQAAVEFFNRNFAALLLGGVYCEAIGLDGLDFGSIIDWTYLRVHTGAPAAANHFHQLVRLKRASAFEAINLVGVRSIAIGELSTTMSCGRALLDAVPELSGEFILKGATGIARRDWGAALTNLWIVVEQITSNIWTRKVLDPVRSSDGLAGRLAQLADPRTWTIAVRHEMLHQIGIIPAETLATLAIARKARNALAHRGRHPTEADAQAAYASALAILQIAVDDLPIPLRMLDLSDHALSDPFRPRPPERLEPAYWMEIPKLPGEAELERQEAAHRTALHKHRQGPSQIS
jgi:hypothetical protein